MRGTRVQEQFNDAEVGVGHAVMQSRVPVIVHHVDQELQHCRAFGGHCVNVARDSAGTRALLSTDVEPLLEHHGQSPSLGDQQGRKSDGQKIKLHTDIPIQWPCTLPFHNWVQKLHPCASPRSDTRS